MLQTADPADRQPAQATADEEPGYERHGKEPPFHGATLF